VPPLALRVNAVSNEGDHLEFLKFHHTVIVFLICLAGQPSA